MLAKTAACAAGGGICDKQHYHSKTTNAAGSNKNANQEEDAQPSSSPCFTNADIDTSTPEDQGESE